MKVGPVLTPSGVLGFIAKVDASGAGLVYCGYVGQSQGVAVDRSQNAYLTGSASYQFPLIKVGPSMTCVGTSDAVVGKIALLDNLSGIGTPRPGATVTMNLAAIEARGLPYQMGTSIGIGPIKVDTRKIGLSVDGLLEISVGGKWPHVFKGYSGMLDSQGKASAKIVIPNAAVLVGQKLYSAFVTIDPSWPSSIRSISETRMIGIVK